MLRPRLSSGVGKPRQISAFGREIPCETSVPERQVKPLMYTAAGLSFFASYDPVPQRFYASQKPSTTLQE